jgi:hypothetical protein
VRQSDERHDSQSEQPKAGHQARARKVVESQPSYHPQAQMLQFQYRSQSVALANRYYLAMIALLDLLAHLRLVNLITTSSKLFFAVAGLSNCHRLDLVSTEPLYFSSRYIPKSVSATKFHTDDSAV